MAEKLVRDLIPEKMRLDGGTPHPYRQLEPREATEALIAKLREETEELIEALREGDLVHNHLGMSQSCSDQIKGEIADVMEVLDAIAMQSRTDFTACYRAKETKRLARGGFFYMLAMDFPD